MDLHNNECLQPSGLCDFDRSPGIRARALELAQGCRSQEEIFQRVYTAVKELPYGLEDWDVPASETLARGWGMCSGKTNLLVAMLRSLGIPARYRVYRITGEASLWGEVTGAEDLARRMGDAPVEQDHVDCEVWLDEWQACDPSRDTPMERGMEELGIPLERQAVVNSSGRVPYLILDTLDDWAKERQDRRRFREDRAEVFARVNEQLARLRKLV
ncbi:MAG: transglutaminase domain-containing protein [Dehalococcoidia bacterium]|nr:MAG: transglutaminase domain-containing protein [Dehalococcoidia bacterium]